MGRNDPRLAPVLGKTTVQEANFFVRHVGNA